MSRPSAVGEQILLEFVGVDPGPESLDLDDIDALVDGDAKVARDIVKEAEVAQARASLTSRRAQGEDISEKGRWRAYVANPRRPLPERMPIPRGVRHQILERFKSRCVTCGRRTEDVELQMGHVLSRSEAYILTHVVRDTTPLRVAGAPENYFAECQKCNLGHGDRSFGQEQAMAVFLSGCGVVGMRAHVYLDILHWCQKADEWRP